MRWRTRAGRAWDSGSVGLPSIVATVLVLGAALGVAGCAEDAGEVAAVQAGASSADRVYLQQFEQWRQARLAALRAPDGWLSYTGSGRLRPGHYRVGTAADNDIALPSGPPRLGLLTLENDQVRFEAARDVDVRLRGKPVGAITLVPEEAGRKADRLDIGGRQFYAVRTGPVYGWRFRDPDAPALRRFTGIEHFAVDPGWRVQAQWHAYPTPRPITLLTSIGTPLSATVPGEARFRRDGRDYRLQAVTQPNDPKLFFIFADRTSGKETYGGARYLFVERPTDGALILDFNRAENPPCALTPHLVCPIAPPGNRLELAVTAGEKTYLGKW
ncbi:MAG TPA: DUF1684 domain-containing protein [Stenotrophomonas sp.]